MRTGKSSATFLFSLLIFFSAILAHGAPQEPRPRAAVTTDVTIIIEKEKVLLTARQAVEYLQLQILDAAGEVVFDSGPIQGNEIAWPFQNGAGEAVKSGLYAYRLTVKEAGQESAQTRRGHFIVDRAKDRDGADKLWVASQESSNVGAELIMVKDENGVIAGMSSNGASVPEQRAEIKGVASGAGTENQTAAVRNSLAITAGTSGQIPKFTSATDLGNSVMAEVSGNIGIGTVTPSSKLTVQTPTASYGVTHTDGNIALTTWVGNGSTGSGGWFGTRSNHSLHFFTNNGGARMTITPSGSVGIGTSNPTGSLEIAGYSPFITLRETQQGRNEPAYIQNSGGSLVFKPTGSGYSTASMVMQANTLNVGIGSTNPQAKLEVASGSGDILRLIGYEPFITLFDSHHGYTPTYIQNAGGSIVFKPSGFGSCCAAMVMQANTGNIGVGTSAPQAKLDVAGQTRTHSLQITGGADFAENFDVHVKTTGAEELAAKVEAGMVVSIDPANPGKLQLSSRAYDRRVAGVISGAGGVKPGMMMSQTGTLADGQHPVALSGRVYVWADAAHGAIKPGDLLTTSPTPGHAMKAVSPAKAQGAILGKAMTELKSGKGLVLVLVTLQ